MKDVCLMTTTFYQSVEDHRCQEAGRLLRRCQEMQVPIIVIDGSPPPVRIYMEDQAPGVAEFHDEVSTSQGNFWPVRQQGFNLLLDKLDQGIRVGGWLEPEKHDLLNYLDQLIRMIAESQCDGTIPYRTEKSMETYPPFQRECEKLGNRAFCDFTGRRLDVWSGPRFFNQRLCRYFAEYNGLYGMKWHGLFVPVMMALDEGLDIRSVDVDFCLPESMRDNECVESNLGIAYDKRIEQLELVTAMRRCHTVLQERRQQRGEAASAGDKVTYLAHGKP